MSRAAAMQSNKKDQKAAIAEKNAEKERLAALGMTPTLKKMIGDDECLCMECGATKNGPLTKCECPGGRKKPGKDDEPIPHLIAAAKARSAENKEADKAEQMRTAAEVQKQRANRKDQRNADKNDLETQLQGDGGVEMMQIVEFPVGKLGMDIEGNCISKIGDAPSNAADLGVKVGWVIGMINDVQVGAKKAAIVKAVATAMKAGPVSFGFRVPIVEGYTFCKSCDKFLVAADEFEEDQLALGPGKQMCSPCYEVSDMGFD